VIAPPRDSSGRTMRGFRRDYNEALARARQAYDGRQHEGTRVRNIAQGTRDERDVNLGEGGFRITAAPHQD
jgi:hypothetical protein